MYTARKSRRSRSGRKGLMTTTAAADSAVTTRQSQNGSAPVAGEPASEDAPGTGKDAQSEADASWCRALLWTVDQMTPEWVSRGRSKQAGEASIRLCSRRELATGILAIVALPSLRSW